MVNRYYDPSSAQFLTQDPLVAVTGQPYQYAGDNPVNGSDPSGLQPGQDSEPECKDPALCQELASKITNAVNDLNKRYQELSEDKLQLALNRPVGVFSYAGHLQQFSNRQTNLRKLLSQWTQNGCDNGSGASIPSDAWQIAETPAPSALPSESQAIASGPDPGFHVTPTEAGVGAGSVIVGALVFVASNPEVLLVFGF